MAKLSILAGATSQSFNIFVQDSSATVGTGLAGIAPAGGALLANFKAYYSFSGANAASVAISLAVLAAVNSAWSSAGIVEIDATNMKGVYRVDIPNAALATAKGRSVTVFFYGGTNVAPVALDIELTSFDNQTAIASTGDTFTRLGAPAGASVSADIAAVKADTAAVKVQTDKFVFTVANQVDSNVIDWKGAAAPAMTGDAFARLGAPAGASVSADVAAIKAVLPAALSGGNIKADVLAINTSATSAARLQRSTLAIAMATVGVGSTTTSIVTSAISPSNTAATQFKGRIVTFDSATTTVNLRGQATDITSDDGAGTLAVTALTDAPANGDTFTIT